MTVIHYLQVVNVCVGCRRAREQVSVYSGFYVLDWLV